MIELDGDTLVFSFPEIHPKARLRVTFERTLRIPDDGHDYPLPPGLGAFPLRHVDDFGDRVPPEWLRHGGVLMPMYQSEAMWILFQAEYLPDHGAEWPFAVKVAAGKIDAVSGKEWTPRLVRDPQNYVVAPLQPWLDGFCVEKGFIRQFVAMPLGEGYTAEEQVTGKAESGGVQILVHPMKREAFEKRFPRIERQACLGAVEADMMPCCATASEAPQGMGLGLGGRMRQEIAVDPYRAAEWDKAEVGRCFVHLANSLVWRAVTGEDPPTVPPTAAEYTSHGLPWFEYYGEGPAVPGSEVLAKLKSVLQIGKKKGAVPLPENKTVDPKNVVHLRKGLKKHQVREGTF